MVVEVCFGWVEYFLKQFYVYFFQNVYNEENLFFFCREKLMIIFYYIKILFIVMILV